MPNPIALQAYPQEMFDVMALRAEQLPVRFSVASKKAGQAWRLSYYGFRSAVERELERSDWDAASPLKQQWMASASFAVAVQEDPFGGGAYVVIAKRVDEGTTKSLREALKLAALPPSEASSQQAVDHDETLARLGFGSSGAAVQQSQPGSGEGENNA